MPFVRRRRPRGLTTFSLAAATAAVTSPKSAPTASIHTSPSSSSLSNSRHDKYSTTGVNNKPPVPSIASLSLLAAQHATFIARTALVTWRKHSRIVEIRSNCLLVYKKLPLPDLSNVDDVIMLTHKNHPYAVNSHIVCVDERHSFYFQHPRQATSFRAALLTITEAPAPNQYYLLDTLNKSHHSAIHAARKIQCHHQHYHHQKHHEHEHEKLKHYNTYHVAEDASSSNNSQSNSENSDIVGFHSDSGVGNTIIQRQYNNSNNNNNRKKLNRNKRSAQKKVSIPSTNDQQKWARDLIEDADNEVFVVKSISKLSLARSDTQKETAYNRFLSERLLLQKAASSNSPFVIRLVDAFETSRHYHLVTQLAQYGSLERVLNIMKGTTQKRLSENAVRQLFSELVLAIYDVHSCGYMYRNLNLRNILLDCKGHIKLNDFSIVKKVHIEYDLLNNQLCDSDSSMSNNNTRNMNRFYLIGRTTSLIDSDENNNLDYLSPEQILNENNSVCNYGSSCDIWSLGIILYYLLVGHYPFEGLLDINDDNEKSRLKWYILNKRIVAPNSINYMSHNAMDLLHALLHRDEYNRIDIHGIMEHPWFSNVNWNEIRYKAQQEHPAEVVLRPLRQSNVSMVKVESNKQLYDDDDSLKEMIFQQQRQHQQQQMIEQNGSTETEKADGIVPESKSKGRSESNKNYFNDWISEEFHNNNEKLLGFNFVR